MKISKIIYAKSFDGMPTQANFKILEEDIGDQLSENEFFYEALYISCDPYIRFLSDSFVVGETCIPGYQLSKVVKSRNEKYPVGYILVINVGWQSGGKSNGSDVLYIRNDIPTNISQSAGFGIFGMTGLTAYYGVDRILNPQKGETLLVSGSAGAVGTVVGQLGKIMGCRVIGSCGSEEKVKFAKSIGYDDVFNYKTESVDDALKRLAPNGIDCYFDNVGGEFTSTVMQHMKRQGRVAACGTISTYNAKEPVKVTSYQLPLILNSIRFVGYNIFNDIPPYADEIYQALKKLAEEGKLKQYEHITEGFENIPCAFVGMMKGDNIGKTVVKI